MTGCTPTTVTEATGGTEVGGSSGQRVFTSIVYGKSMAPSGVRRRAPRLTQVQRPYGWGAFLGFAGAVLGGRGIPALRPPLFFGILWEMGSSRAMGGRWRAGLAGSDSLGIWALMLRAGPRRWGASCSSSPDFVKVSRSSPDPAGVPMAHVRSPSPP